MASNPNDRKKFLFDLHNFDEEAEAERLRKNPPQPTFSLQDMEDARKAAFEKGREEGLRVAVDSIEQKTEILMQSVVQNIHDLERAEAQRSEMFVQNSIAIADKALQKLLPDIIRTHGNHMLFESLRLFFEDSRPKTSILLTVHPSMVEATQKQIDLLGITMTIKGDEKLSTTQAIMKWDDGHLNFSPEALSTSILGILKTYYSNTAEMLDDSEKTPHNEQDTPKDNIEDPSHE